MDLIYGICSVRNALLATHRRRRLERLLVYQAEVRHQPTIHGQRINQVLQIAQERLPKLKIQHVSKTELDRIIGGGRPHQNVAIACTPLELEEINRPPQYTGHGRSVMVVLDGIKDPQNLGALIRTSYYMNATGIVIPGTSTSSHHEITGTVSRASAGVVEGWEAVYRTRKIVDFLQASKTLGWRVLIADAPSSSTPMDDGQMGQDNRSLVYEEKILLVLGEEGRGISPSVKAIADSTISIHSKRSAFTDSLNVSVAAGILLDRLLKV